MRGANRSAMPSSKSGSATPTARTCTPAAATARSATAISRGSAGSSPDRPASTISARSNPWRTPDARPIFITRSSYAGKTNSRPSAISKENRATRRTASSAASATPKRASRCSSILPRSRPRESAKAPVADTYHGVAVQDDYRWLEDWNDPQVKKWSDAQNGHARAVLDRLPHVAAIRTRVTEIMSAKTVSYSGLEYRQGMLFAIKREPPRQQPFLIVFPSAVSLENSRVLVDPNVIDSKGTTSI